MRVHVGIVRSFVWRLRWPLAAVVLGVLAAACGSSSSTTGATAAATTDTFNGTVLAGNGDFQIFTVAQAGTVTATLVSLSPQTTITVGFGIGQPTSGTCGLLTSTDSAHVGNVLSGPLTPGSYCVAIYDVGNIQSSDTYAITVNHP